jgi:hypothetical protein
MGMPAIHNRHVLRLVAFYMFVIVIFGFLSSVLSVIFVIESIISDEGHDTPAYIPIGIETPEVWGGRNVDPCSKSIAEPSCEYDLAMTALTSQLVTYTNYTVGRCIRPS